MDQLKETLRLRWQSWSATGLEKWRIRCELWLARARLRLAEMNVRICLARRCLAIYRREVAHHREETALMKLAFWEDRLAEEAEESWDHSEEPTAGASSETRDIPGGVRGISWRIWGRLSVIGWLLLIPASWASLFLFRAGMEFSSFCVFALWLGLGAAWNGIPGVSALLNPEIRARLLSMPEAAALSMLTFSAAVGLCGGLIATCLHLEAPVSIALQGVVFGIMFFPLSFGLVFPLAIPLVCCFTVWAVSKRYGRIPRLGYAVLSGISAAGWLGVAVVGPAFGIGG